MSADIILRTRDVAKRFGKLNALNGVSAEFRRNVITSIIGPNGAGKSTYFNLLCGALQPSSGAIEFEGRDVTGLAQHRFAHMGIVKSFQITTVFPQLSTHENVRLAAQAMVSTFDMWRPRTALKALIEKADRILDRVGLADRRDRPAGLLAHGEQRALEIGVALASEPKLLLLDEPTAGMSPQETREVMDLIVGLAAERTIILVEHKMKLVLGVSERLIVLHHGELLAEGAPDDIKRNDMVKRVYLGQRNH
ncbi:MAG TPA: ABC transporter ATP-binding protein [Roseiarcus sp.]|nr:ABC transporter ATP-binding protein [Roseiarcus sp.]